VSTHSVCRGIEYYGRVEQHNYQLYLAINDIVIVALLVV